MTTSPPPSPPVSSGTGRPVVAGRPGLLSRLKLEEPVRLYLYGLAVVAVAGLTLAGVITGEWSDYVLHVLAVLLVVPGAEAARASVYSPASTLEAIRRAAGGPIDPASEIQALYGGPK